MNEVIILVTFLPLSTLEVAVIFDLYLQTKTHSSTVILFCRRANLFQNVNICSLTTQFSVVVYFYHHILYEIN